MDGMGGYAFVREIGRGVHGRVFLAKPPATLETDVGEPNELVAVKVLSAPAVDGGFDAVVEELQAYAGVGSPLLVHLHDVGLEGSTVFYAMTHHPGGALASPAREVSRRERVAAVGRAAHAAHELHEAGIVHRAIKPSNILLEPGGSVLAEPAVAHLVSRAGPLTGLGTRGSARDLEFLDPLLMRGAAPGRGSDIWSLGITLHIALTGYGLYPALMSADPLVAARMFVRSRPQPDAELAAAERTVVAKALHPDLAQRYLTAEAMAADVERLIA